MKRYSLAVLLLACTMMLGLSACGTTTTPDNNLEDTEIYSITTVENWDFSDGFYAAITPDKSTHGIQYWLLNFYDTLVIREGDEYKGNLAERWDISDDEKSYTFHLKKDVKFSDGTALTAEAVKTSIMAAIQNLGMYAASAGKLSTILASIEAVDEVTLKINLTAPYYGLLNDLALCYPMGIVSPKAFNEDLTVKEDIMTATFGTGPYMYAGNTDGTTYTFVKNPYYHGQDPDVDEFKIKVISDLDATVLALRNGEIDLIPGSTRLSFDGYKELSNADGIKTIIDSSTSNSRFMGFNVQKTPFDDLAVRQAVAFALDKETLANTVFSSLETPATELLDKNLPYCNVQTTTYDFNVQKAKELLENTGWIDSDNDGIREKDGKKLSVTLDYISDQSFLDDAVLVIAQSLKDIGMNVTPRGADSYTWYTNIVKGDWEFSLHQTYGGYNDPYLTITNMNPDLMTDPVLYQVADLLENGKDTLLELDTISDTDRIQAIYDEILTTAADQAVLIPLTYMHQYAAYNTDRINSFSFGSNQLFIEIANVKLP